MEQRFYIRYYVGHKGKFGHEFLEFEFRPDGKLRYANNSNYKNDTMIRKEAYVSPDLLMELKRIVDDAEIMKENDALWREVAAKSIGEKKMFFCTSTELRPHLRPMARPGQGRPPRAGDPDRRRAHLLHHFENRLSLGHQRQQGPRRLTGML